MLKKITKTARAHKFITTLITLTFLIALFLIYKGTSGAKQETLYVREAVQKGTLITSISGSGQTSSLNQIDIKPKVSGDILTMNMRVGQEVKARDVLAVIDSHDAETAVRDAQTSLTTAQISLEKLKQPPDEYQLLQAENSLQNSKDSLKKMKDPPDPLALLQAENSLQNAKDSLEKLKLSQETNYHNAQEAKQKAEDDLIKAYEDALPVISDSFLDFPAVITTLHDILYSNAIGASEPFVRDELTNMGALLDSTTEETDRYRLQSFQDKAVSDYESARTAYETVFEINKNTTRSASQTEIDALLTKTMSAGNLMVQAAASERNYIDTWVDYRSAQKQTVFAKVKEYQTALGASISQTNGHISSITNMQNTVIADRDAIEKAKRDILVMDQTIPLDRAASEATINERENSLKKLKDGATAEDIASAEASLKEKELSLARLKAGTDPLDIRSQELNVAQRRNALASAQEKLKNYTIVAPFDGIVAKADVKQGDSVSASSVIATLITKQKTAVLSFNEVDAAGIKTGQKATLTFDAIEDLTISGEVAELDLLGTVSQGVVTYSATIAFDTQDNRVKPGMSVNASIITAAKQDALIVSSSAVKTQGNAHYVEMLDNTTNASPTTPVPSKTPPMRVPVEIGLSNDTSIEIVSGLKEGDMVITKTVAPSATANTSPQAPSLFGSQGGGRGIRGGGGGFRIPRD